MTPPPVQPDSNGQPCEMCQFAGESEKSRAKSPSDASGLENQGAGFPVPEPENVSEVKYGAGIAIPAPDFDREWDAAPSTHTRYTERNEAQYWFQRGVWAGIQYERERGLVTMNQDLREMQRMARERVG